MVLFVSERTRENGSEREKMGEKERKLERKRKNGREIVV